MIAHKTSQTVAGILILAMLFLLMPACNVTADSTACNRFTISFDDGGNPSYDVPDTFTAFAGTNAIGSATGTVSATRSSVTIPLNPTQPNGTVISVKESKKGNTVASAPCSSPAANNSVPQWFNPGDGRVDPLAGDRIAAYCDVTKGVIVVYIVKPDSTGKLQGIFNYKNVLAAGTHGLAIDTGINGVLSLSVDHQYNFWLAWNGGQYKADGQLIHGFAKGFNCDFSSVSK